VKVRTKFIVRVLLLKLVNLLRALLKIYKLKYKVVIIGSQFENSIGIARNFADGVYLDDGIKYYLLSDLRVKHGVYKLKKWSLKHVLLAVIADAYIVSHKVADVFIVKPAGVFVINLWHGVPYKPIGFYSEVEIQWINKQIRLNGKCEYDNWDLLISYSELHQNLMKLITKERCNSYKVLGNPNVNVLKYSKLKKRRDKVTSILYCPTFRNKGELNQHGIEDVIRLSEELGQEYKFILKLHPLLKILPAKLPENVVFYNGDVYDILIAADIVITDYSSLLFDTISLKGKVLIYSYDFNNYTKIVGKPLLDVKKIAGAHVSSSLLSLKKDVLNYEALTVDLEYGNEYQRQFDFELFNRVINEKV